MDPLTALGVSLDFETLMRLRPLGAAMHGGRMPRLTRNPGNFVHRQRGRGLEINDVRPWLFGDDTRHIDRNATARTGVQHIRTFRDERDRTLLLVVDFRPSMLFGTKRAFRSVAAAEALALIGWHAVAHGIRIASMAIGVDDMGVAPGRGVNAMAQTLNFWVSAHTAALKGTALSEPTLGSVLQQATRGVRAGSTIVVGTSLDTLGADFDAVISWLVQRNEIRFAIIRDAFERHPARGHYPFVADDQQRGVMNIGQRVLSAVEPRCDALRKRGASALVVDSDLGWEQLATRMERLIDA
jgi:hypothetical protein